MMLKMLLGDNLSVVIEFTALRILVFLSLSL